MDARLRDWQTNTFALSSDSAWICEASDAVGTERIIGVEYFLGQAVYQSQIKHALGGIPRNFALPATRLSVCHSSYIITVASCVAYRSKWTQIFFCSNSTIPIQQSINMYDPHEHLLLHKGARLKMSITFFQIIHLQTPVISTWLERFQLSD